MGMLTYTEFFVGFLLLLVLTGLRVGAQPNGTAYVGLALGAWLLAVLPVIREISPILGLTAGVLPGLGAGLPNCSLIWQQAVLLACVLPLGFFLNQLLLRGVYAQRQVLVALVFLILTGVTFLFAESLLLVLLSFELFLLVSVYLLVATAKSERISEASAEMLFWTLIGSLGLFTGFFSLLADVSSLSDLSLASLNFSGFTLFFFLLGFGVKLPLWPCFSWLLKAHVEASVEFSVLLSGVIVKFGAYGLYRFLGVSGEGVGFTIVAGCALLGVMEATLKLLSQRDLKRIVALTTVIELNWAGLCLGLGTTSLEALAAFLLVAHSLTTTAEFFTVECLYKRYHTRDLTKLSGISTSYPLLFLCSFVSTLVTIGFPLTSIFWAKLVFFTELGQLSLPLNVVLILLFMLVTPIAFFRIWVPVWFGTPTQGQSGVDLTSRELLVFFWANLGALGLGIFPGLLFSGILC